VRGCHEVGVQRDVTVGTDITRVPSDERVTISSATVSAGRDRVAIIRFTFELDDPKHLGHVLHTIRGVDGV